MTASASSKVTAAPILAEVRRLVPDARVEAETLPSG
jgi:hypothetical protein